MLLKTICQGYLKGCPNLTATGITKYLKSIPTTAKGHMKHPRMGIHITLWQNTHVPSAAPTRTNTAHIEVLSTNSLSPNVQPSPTSYANIIGNNNTSLDANIFCFDAFADKRTDILYNNLTGAFPFMSLEGNNCFLIVCHQETNAILDLPIMGFSNNIIFAAYQQQYNLLESKGYKIQLNVTTIRQQSTRPSTASMI
jgi:hypothetical protein